MGCSPTRRDNQREPLFKRRCSCVRVDNAYSLKPRRRVNNRPVDSIQAHYITFSFQIISQRVINPQVSYRHHTKSVPESLREGGLSEDCREMEFILGLITNPAVG